MLEFITGNLKLHGLLTTDKQSIIGKHDMVICATSECMYYYFKDPRLLCERQAWSLASLAPGNRKAKHQGKHFVVKQPGSSPGLKAKS